MKKNYWYLSQVIECPVCGRVDEFKERRYTEKPKDKKDRYNYKQEYCYCEDRE